MDRSQLRNAISRRIGDRNLVFFGTRGDDVEGVGDQPQLAAAFSLIGTHRGRSGLLSGSLEDICGSRVDLDSYDIDDELQAEAVVELRRQVMRVLSRPSVVFTYRPSTFLSAICFARAAMCEYAGMFAAHQSAFEHKPWVESMVQSQGIQGIPWTYVADEDQIDSLHYLADGPIVLRRSRSSGGTGLVRIDSADDLQGLWPQQEEAFVSVSPYIPDGVPANVSAVVWPKEVTLHGVSVQLIGVPGLTSRPFGYCGNDFAAAKQLDPQVIAQMEAATSKIGGWLGQRGFRGAFGVDFLIDGDRALFMEVNPRLQGVTHLACQIAAGQDRSCVLMEHLAANLGLDVLEPGPSLLEQVRSAPDVAHLVVHAPDTGKPEVSGEELAFAASSWPSVRRVDVVCPTEVEPQCGATLARLTVGEQVTATGFELEPGWADRISSVEVEAYEW